jgi:SOS-response transcriptional repressor LexA
VDEHWLKTGKGDMFVANDNTLLAALVSEYDLDSLDRTILEAYLKLPENKRGAIKDFVASVAKDMKSSEAMIGSVFDEDEQDAPLYAIKNTAAQQQTRAKTIKIPVSRELASAGRGYYLDSGNVEMMTFSVDDVPHGTSLGVRINGDSMEPDIPDGSLVFVQSVPAIDSGEIGLFGLNGEGYCKVLYVDHEHSKIELRSHNKKYEPIEILESDYLVTFGRVLGVFEG